MDSMEIDREAFESQVADEVLTLRRERAPTTESPSSVNPNLFADDGLAQFEAYPMKGVESMHGAPAPGNVQPGSPVSQRVIIVVDTNYLLADLTLIADIINKAVDFNARLLVPYTVIQELDGLKNSTKKVSATSGAQKTSVELGSIARRAIALLQEAFLNRNPGIIGQRKGDNLLALGAKNKAEEAIIYSKMSNDDLILECCKYAKAKMPSAKVILMSNDRNLCLKAMVESFQPVSRYHKSAKNLLSELQSLSPEEAALNFQNPVKVTPPVVQKEPTPVYRMDDGKEQMLDSNMVERTIDFDNIQFQSYHEVLVSVTNAYEFVMNIIIPKIFQKEALKLENIIGNTWNSDEDRNKALEKLNKINKWYGRQLSIGESFTIVRDRWDIFGSLTSKYTKKKTPDVLLESAIKLLNHRAQVMEALHTIAYIPDTIPFALTATELLNFIDISRTPINDFSLAAKIPLDDISRFSSWVARCKEIIKKNVQPGE